MQRKSAFGPGLLVTAAFIGPGTVTTASVAGAQFGFALVWAVGFSVFATLVLQEMAARLGVIARSGLGEALRTVIQTPLLRITLPLLVVIGIGGGNAAFEMGKYPWRGGGPRRCLRAAGIILDPGHWRPGIFVIVVRDVCGS